jgi:hypothetical protein
MKGRVLGFDAKNGEGAITGADGNRYSFQLAEWKGEGVPKAEVTVDFVPREGVALQIYPIRDLEAENSRLILGIISLLITLFLGFIGTLISRLGISKIPFPEIIVPVLIHLVITLLVFVPLIGWVLYAIGTIYFMVKNYQLVETARTGEPASRA